MFGNRVATFGLLGLETPTSETQMLQTDSSPKKEKEKISSFLWILATRWMCVMGVKPDKPYINSLHWIYAAFFCCYGRARSLRESLSLNPLLCSSLPISLPPLLPRTIASSFRLSSRVHQFSNFNFIIFILLPLTHPGELLFSSRFTVFTVA